jgi:hypothetical protein
MLRHFAFARPHGRGNNSTVDDRVICGRIFDSPALIDALKDLFRFCTESAMAMTISRDFRYDESG